ncbi:MAG TPA: AAA family ATPase [Candidatus Sulfotelmatobacter sp.]|nr:AAA family ATPase [Candidatus Sulfotelmatobacter sp.]
MILFTGIPGSGKTTFYLERFFHTHVRINLDMLKTRRREMLLVQACLTGKTKMVIDNTNVSAAERAVYISLAREAGFRVEGYYFQAELKEALQRNRLRVGKARIKDIGLVARYRRLEIPAYAEGFDQLYDVRIDTVTHQFNVEERLLPGIYSGNP